MECTTLQSDTLVAAEIEQTGFERFVSRPEAIGPANSRALPTGTIGVEVSTSGANLAIEESVIGLQRSDSTLRIRSRHYTALSKDLRKAKRHRYVVVGTVMRPDGRYLTRMLVENISVGGLAFRSNQTLKVGDRPLLEVAINGRSHHVRVIVRRTFHSNSARLPHGCGVEYINPRSELAQEVRDLTDESALVAFPRRFGDDSLT